MKATVLAVVFSAAAVLAAVAAPAHAGAAPPPPPQQQCEGKAALNEPLRRELLRMFEADQAARVRWNAAKDDEAAGRAMTALDEKHAGRLRAIFKEHGFPGFCLVGRDGAQAAHVMLLHSPSLELQKEALPLVEAAVKKGELPAQAAATLTDKVLVGEGKPQIYGTHFSFVDGKLVMSPVSDPEGLEARRARVGLPPLKEYIEGLERMYHVKAEAGAAPPPTTKKKP